MRALRRSSFTSYVIIPITLVALFSGCFSRKSVETGLQVGPTFRSETALQSNEIVAVTTVDGTYIELDGPAVLTNDTIRAMVAWKPNAWAVADLDRIWVKKTARGFKPASLVLPAMLVSLIVWGARMSP